MDGSCSTFFLVHTFLSTLTGAVARRPHWLGTRDVQEYTSMRTGRGGTYSHRPARTAPCPASLGTHLPTRRPILPAVGMLGSEEQKRELLPDMASFR